MSFILVFILTFIVIQIFLILLYFSRLRFRFEKCQIIYNEKSVNKFDIKELELYVDLMILKNIKILTVKVTTEYCLLFNIKFNVDGIKKIKRENENSIIFVLKNLNKLNPCINKFELILSIGTREMMLDVFLIPAISTYISIWVSKYFLESQTNQFYMKINLNFLSVNNFVLNLKTIVDFKAIRFLFFIIKRRNKIIEK